MDNIPKELAELKLRVQALESKRIYQMDIVPDAVKTRHMGEPNRFVVSGLAADRPNGYTVTGGTLAYFATDTNVYSLWNGTTWVSETFS